MCNLGAYRSDPSGDHAKEVKRYVVMKAPYRGDAAWQLVHLIVLLWMLIACCRRKRVSDTLFHTDVLDRGLEMCANRREVICVCQKWSAAFLLKCVVASLKPNVSFHKQHTSDAAPHLGDMF